MVNSSSRTMCLWVCCRLGVVYHSDLLPQAAALLFSRNRTVARAASLMLQETLGRAGSPAAAGRLQECIESALLLSIHRAAPADMQVSSGSRGSRSPNLLQLQEEAAEPLTALPLSPFEATDAAALDALLSLFCRKNKHSGFVSLIGNGAISL